MYKLSKIIFGIPHLEIVNLRPLLMVANSKFPNEFRDEIIKGDSEIDLVRSGLEDTMRNSYKIISDVWNSDDKIADLRTAAMMVAIKRVAQSYTSLGI